MSGTGDPLLNEEISRQMSETPEGRAILAERASSSSQTTMQVDQEATSRKRKADRDLKAARQAQQDAEVDEGLRMDRLRISQENEAANQEAEDRRTAYDKRKQEIDDKVNKLRTTSRVLFLWHNYIRTRTTEIELWLRENGHTGYTPFGMMLSDPLEDKELDKIAHEWTTLQIRADTGPEDDADIILYTGLTKADIVQIRYGKKIPDNYPLGKWAMWMLGFFTGYEDQHFIRKLQCA